MGQGEGVAGKWRQLYLNNNKKSAKKKKEKIFKKFSEQAKNGNDCLCQIERSRLLGHETHEWA